MGFTYSLSTDIGKIRLIIFDANPAQYIFEDEEVTIFLAIEGSRIKRAAALALETIASNQALVLKAITLLDLTTDGPKVSAELRARAKGLRDQDAAALLLEDATDDAGFEIAEWPSMSSCGDYILRQYGGRY